MTPEGAYREALEELRTALLRSTSCHQRAAIHRMVARICLAHEIAHPEGVIREIWARRRRDWNHRAEWWTRRGRGEHRATRRDHGTSELL